MRHHERQDRQPRSEAHPLALAIAGRLLQAPVKLGGFGVRIERIEHAGTKETYLDALSRVIATLNDARRERLRTETSWVVAYERAEATMASLIIAP